MAPQEPVFGIPIATTSRSSVKVMQQIGRQEPAPKILNRAYTRTTSTISFLASLYAPGEKLGGRYEDPLAKVALGSAVDWPSKGSAQRGVRMH